MCGISLRCFWHNFQDCLDQHFPRCVGLWDISSGISQESTLIHSHTWVGYCNQLPFSTYNFPSSFILISLFSPLSLNIFSSLLASGLCVLTQTPKDQIKTKKKRAKIFPFQMEEQMELLALQRIQIDPLHQAQGRQTVTADWKTLKRPVFPSNIQ